MTMRVDGRLGGKSIAVAPQLQLKDDGCVQITFGLGQGAFTVLMTPAAAGSFFGAGMRLVRRHQERMKAKPLPGQRSIYDELD